MNKLIIILTIGTLVSCHSNIEKKEKTKTKIVQDTIRIVEKTVDTIYIEKSDKEDFTQTEWYIKERLPEWFALGDGLKFQEEYEFDNRLNPLYLETDFNGDGTIDLAIPIKQTKTDKVGFAIIHGKTNEVFIIGAGTLIKNQLSDDMIYIDIWKVNREKVNEPGLDENGNFNKNGSLILTNPSMQVEKSDVGGGQIYWNGTEYVYFHQTC
ncbi:hypothetical protein [Ascidiimonas sp. W6]|uniref:hypothetical protein n=1 Tax=Ascidiimonas meishanensis TaxID=3128903 RepID=UPI0030EF6960